MRWLIRLIGVAARMVFYVVILAWVVIGQIKVSHVLFAGARNKSPETADAGSSGKSTPVAG